MQPPSNPKGNFRRLLKQRANKLDLLKINSDRFYQFLLIGLVIISFGLMLGAFIKLFATVSISSNPITPTPTVSPTPAPITPEINLKVDQNPTDSSANIITLNKFNQIQNGMTIEQVQKLIGNEGKLLASSNIGNVTGKVYWWQNPQGSNAIVEFRKDQVVSKSQSGLK